jgi:hypothetical protein
MGVIPLRDQAGSVTQYAWVDDVDDRRVTAMGPWHWYTKDGKGFVLSGNHRHRVRLNRFLLGVKDPLVQVVHVDGNGLNNTRANLRKVVSQSSPIGRPGRSGVVGISWSIAFRKWLVKGRYKSKGFYLGEFADLEEAKEALTAWKEQHDQDLESADG